MITKNTLSNRVQVELDPDNDFIVTPKGVRLLVDTTFEPEKHVVRVGTVTSLPEKLYYRRKLHINLSAEELKNQSSTRLRYDGMPWKTEMELKIGDRVVMYFMAVQNCLRNEYKWYVREGKTIRIFIKYQNIYAAIRDGKVIPVNGYVLVEPVEDPDWIRKLEKAKSAGLELPDLRKPSNTNVVFGRIVYQGIPNQEYYEETLSDAHHEEKIGDVVVMKKISDIPIEYEYHAKIDGGRKLYRLQKHDILAVVNYPPTAKLMGWASWVKAPSNEGNVP
jgi:co-chaperonin GroES (HSP10)